MAACYFLAQNASKSDERVIRALVAKLTDTKAIQQNEFDNARGIVRSEFYGDACVADALTVMSPVDVSDVQTSQ